ncbi:MAG: RIP metalloprotease RseP [Acidobacteria bacterium]|nr:MAG: RIP metalloprotease RseP [Acidobacteriota bacterium]
MTSAFYTLVGAVLVLGVMVLVHEFGHFAAAKLLGVRVEVFSIGFGKRLFGFRRGDTDYRVSLLPLGGYVKMTGVNAVELPDPAVPANDKGAFLNHPRWQRLIIAVAGPLANLILAVALLTLVFSVHHEVPYGLYDPAVVGWCAPGYPAEKAGLKEGDQILQIGDIQNPTWQDVQNKILISPNQPVALRVKRGSEVLPITLVPKADGQQQTGEVGWLPKRPFIVTGLEKNMPGEQAGLRIGDQILTVDGKAIHATGAMQAYLQTTKTQPVRLDILRQNQPLTLTITPKLGQLDAKTQTYRIGFMSEPVQVEKLPVGEAFSRSVNECKKLSGLVFELIQGMVERKVSMKQMSGPIEIVRVSGEMVHHRSLNDLMGFIAIISLQLGLFNLLPIPIMDGGLIALLLVESVMRRDINEAVKLRLYQAAFVCLVLFAGMVIFNDVMKMLPRQ